jgi:hypothetical protein
MGVQSKPSRDCHDYSICLIIQYCSGNSHNHSDNGT